MKNKFFWRVCKKVMMIEVQFGKHFSFSFWSPRFSNFRFFKNCHSMMPLFTLLFCIASGIVSSYGLFSQDRQFPSAREFMDLPLDKAFPIISRMNKEQVKEMITQIRAESKNSNPDIDKLYFLISHLEEIRAVEREQSRLASLLWVYGLGLFLFSGFLLYVFIHQRKVIREIQWHRK